MVLCICNNISEECIEELDHVVEDSEEFLALFGKNHQCYACKHWIDERLEEIKTRTRKSIPVMING